MYEKNEPLLSFDYVDPNGNKNPLMFKNPRTVITTDSVNEVVACLEKIQVEVDRGYYAAGYVSYEAAPAFDPAFQVNTNSEMPLLWFGIFDEPVHEPLKGEGSFHLSEWEPTVTPEDYKANIERIKNNIAAGDTYQVNFTTRLHAHFTGDTKAYYKQLAQVQSADYAAYLDIGDHTILSASPELFFQLDDGKITTRPMKGTVKRPAVICQEENN
ncbi:hypothetical protein EU245_14830 [Lentibacillus lipolyticus]|nr:hypothetical protein EU245_14830 [Lentibacillus lipolyticus]